MKCILNTQPFNRSVCNSVTEVKYLGIKQNDHFFSSYFKERMLWNANQNNINHSLEILGGVTQRPKIRILVILLIAFCHQLSH